MTFATDWSTYRESYAGQYIPYISYYMLMTNDTKYFNVKGIQINDPSINSDAIMIEGESEKT